LIAPCQFYTKGIYVRAKDTVLPFQSRCIAKEGQSIFFSGIYGNTQQQVSGVVADPV